MREYAEVVWYGYLGDPMSDEHKNVHAEWCNVWTTITMPCNCGARGRV